MEKDLTILEQEQSLNKVLQNDYRLVPFRPYQNRNELRLTVENMNFAVTTHKRDNQQVYIISDEGESSLKEEPLKRQNLMAKAISEHMDVSPVNPSDPKQEFTISKSVDEPYKIFDAIKDIRALNPTTEAYKEQQLKKSQAQKIEAVQKEIIQKNPLKKDYDGYKLNYIDLKKIDTKEVENNTKDMIEHSISQGGRYGLLVSEKGYQDKYSSNYLFPLDESSMNTIGDTNLNSKVTQQTYNLADQLLKKNVKNLESYVELGQKEYLPKTISAQLKNELVANKTPSDDRIRDNFKKLSKDLDLNFEIPKELQEKNSTWYITYNRNNKERSGFSGVSEIDHSKLNLTEKSSNQEIQDSLLKVLDNQQNHLSRDPATGKENAAIIEKEMQNRGLNVEKKQEKASNVQQYQKYLQQEGLER